MRLRVLACILIVFRVVPAEDTGLQAQSCDTLAFKGAEYFDASDFRTALRYVHQARECFLREGEYESYLRCIGFELDCLEKLSAYRELSELLELHTAEVNRLSDKLTREELISPGSSNVVFRALLAGRLGNIDKSISILDSQLDSLELIPVGERTTDDSIRICKMLLFLSEAYLEKGNFELARQSAYAAVHIGGKLERAVSSGMLLRPLMSLAASQFKEGNEKEAWQTFHYLEEQIANTKGRKTERAIQVANSLFQIFLQSGNIDSAETYLAHLNVMDRNDQYSADLLRFEGDLAIERGDPYAAEEAYLTSLSIRLRQQGATNEDVASLHQALGRAYFLQSRYAEAVEQFHRGLYCSTGYHQDKPTTLMNPELEALYPLRLVLELLEGKTRSLRMLYEQDNSSEYLQAAWETSRLCVRFMEKLRSEYVAASDKSILIDDTYPVFEEALHIAHTFYSRTSDSRWLDTAFVLMEESKALNLREAIRRGNAREFSGLPDDLLELEHALKLEISGKENLIREFRTSGNYSEEVLFSYQHELAETKERYRKLIERFEKEYPKYYTLIHRGSTPSLRDFIKGLETNQELIEYFCGDSLVFCLNTYEGSTDFTVVPAGRQLGRMVREYRESQFEYVNQLDQGSVDSYSRIAFELYKVLFPQNILPGKRLLIIPDGILGYIAFAGLISELPGQRQDLETYSFLVRNYDISYCYSAQLYDQLKHNSRDQYGGALICAPDFQTTPELSALPNQRTEAMEVRGIIHGDLLSGAGCTVPALVQHIEKKQYGILHLATHGSANDEIGESSFLVFSGEANTSKLFVRDLYDLDLHLDLVYLSACETGAGELQRGEGIMSLARGFFYAGAQSLVTTLWRVGDSRAANLAQAFYRNIGKGMSKDKALAEAQRHYLDNLQGTHRIYAHPVYWAALVPIGNVSPISLDTVGNSGTLQMALMVVGIILVIGIGFGLARRRR